MLQQIILDPAVILNLLAMIFTAIYIYHLCGFEERQSSLPFAKLPIAKTPIAGLPLISKNRVMKGKRFASLNQFKPDFRSLNQNNPKFGSALYMTQTKTTTK